MSSPRLRFTAHQRIRSERDFQRAYARRRSASEAGLIVYACENETGLARLGLSVSRKVGNAVTRNAWKRAIREAFRRHQHELPAGTDFVVVVRGGTERFDVSPVLIPLFHKAHRKLIRAAVNE
jgi:ribonuclease P protein component